MKRIKAYALACPIAVVEHIMNEGGVKRYSPPTQQMLVEKKLKTSSAGREGLPATKRPVIDLTSSDWKKNEVAKSEPMTFAMPKMTSTIADKIAQHRGSIMAVEACT
ncbi:hypothetical protein TB2_021880 [Malus domestica]